MRWRVDGCQRGHSAAWAHQLARYVLPAAPALLPGKAWAFLGPNGGRRRGRRDHADPTTTSVAISLAPTTPALPTGLVRSPTVRPPKPGAPLCRGPGEIAPRGGPGHRLALVALMPQWRQDYPNNRPPTWATVISAVGQNRPPALQKNRTTFAPRCVPTQPRPR
jgi:hypothetical protein